MWFFPDCSNIPVFARRPTPHSSAAPAAIKFPNWNGHDAFPPPRRCVVDSSQDFRGNRSEIKGCSFEKDYPNRGAKKPDSFPCSDQYTDRMNHRSGKKVPYKTLPKVWEWIIGLSTADNRRAINSGIAALFSPARAGIGFHLPRIPLVAAGNHLFRVFDASSARAGSRPAARVQCFHRPRHDAARHRRRP